MRKLSAGVDSLSIMTPIQYFYQLDYRITSNVIEVFEESGEIHQDRKNIPLIVNDYGIKLRCQKVQRFGIQYIFMTLNSRIFGKELVENGIFKFLTIDRAEYILSLINKYFKFDIDVNDWLMYSTVYDVDFAYDFRLMQSEFEDVVKSYETVPTQKTYYSHIENFLGEKERLISGIQFINRADGSNKRPFCKVYTKYLEFKDKSSVFRDMHLKEFEDMNLRRLECTVRNSRHFSFLASKGILNSQFLDGDITLYKVLSLDMERVRSIIQYCFGQHIHYDILQTIKSNGSRSIALQDLSPSDFFITELVVRLLYDGWDLKNIFRIMEFYPTDNDEKKRVYKSRIKKRVIKGLKSNLLPSIFEELTKYKS